MSNNTLLVKWKNSTIAKAKMRVRLKINKGVKDVEALRNRIVEQKRMKEEGMDLISIEA